MSNFCPWWHFNWGGAGPAGLAADYSEILLTNKQQKQDIKQLTKRADIIQKLNNEDHLKIDKVEQYDRRQNLELQGVPVTKNEDVMKITLDLIKKLDVDIEEEDISIAHRLPQKRRLGRTRANKATNHLAIIVRLVSRLKRNEICANRFKAKDIEGFPVDGMEKVFINKNLTRRRKRLFWNTKQKAKELGYKFFWTHNGQIYTRKVKKVKKFISELKVIWNSCKFFVISLFVLAFVPYSCLPKLNCNGSCHTDDR